jgi:hypothetical protein
MTPTLLLILAAARIPILLYDYAGVSPDTVSQAKAAASRILEDAGVQLLWLECPCEASASARALQVRIIPKEMAKLSRVGKDSMGYALVLDGSGRVAAVFYYRALELEKGNLADRASILGAMLAHEIGHLLLGESSHAREGIMRAVWDDGDLKAIARGRMLFTSGQRALLANSVVEISGDLRQPLRALQ